MNWIAYYWSLDGYGRFNSRFVRALQNRGVHVKAATMDSLGMPEWMQKQEGIDWDELTISCLPPYLLKSVPGRHWLFSMVEGSSLPVEWVKTINKSNVERVLVPCQHNADAFTNSGVLAPVSVIPGGTDPDEFPLRQPNRHEIAPGYERPYTFLTFSDRGFRKGWEEVWNAFYLAFGGKTTGIQDVRLVIKSRVKEGLSLPYLMSQAEGADKRVIYQIEDIQDMRTVYNQADVLALPSRCEGWGMPHREAASMGIPVIVQNYAGTEDSYPWALVLEQGQIQAVPKEHKPSIGEWMVADVDELAEYMQCCYRNPLMGIEYGASASSWIRENQTWGHAADKLIDLMEATCALSMERATLPIFAGASC